MGFVGLTALAVVSAGPAARRVGAGVLGAVNVRLARAALVFGVLGVPAVLSDMARSAAAGGDGGGYDYAAAWDSLYDGSNSGRLSGLEVTFILVGVVLIAPLTVRRVSVSVASAVASAGGVAGRWLLSGALGAGAIALGTTKFPDKVPTDWGRSVFETLMWMLHLLGGGVWIGGLIGLALLAVPGAVAREDSAAFWSGTIRRFSAAAMSCVGAIVLSGLFLYWEHVDGPSQLFTTMYGRVLGVKILLFGGMLLLGTFNQFWLHPRIDALRSAGDERPLRTILLKQFPAVVGAEVVLGLAVLFVAPFLHGSARNQAYQAGLAANATAGSATGHLPKLAAKVPDAGTWIWGSVETIAVVALMIIGYRVSGRIARRRAAALAAPATSGPELDQVGAAVEHARRLI